VQSDIDNVQPANLQLQVAAIHGPAEHVMLILTFALSPAKLSVYLKDGWFCLLCTFKGCHAASVQ
jgi:hypothetical protein